MSGLAIAGDDPSTPRGPVVVDTNVLTATLRSGSRLAATYAPHLAGRRLAVAYPSVAEAWYGSLRAQWGPARRQALADLLGEVAALDVDDQSAEVTARLRYDCLRRGHPLHQGQHTADLWIAATAVRWKLPLVSHDGVFIDCPGLDLITELKGSP